MLPLTSHWSRYWSSSSKGISWIVRKHQVSQASHINDPAHWRERAKQMRAMAEDVRETEAKEAMLRVAKEYDRLAERADIRSGG